MRIEMIFSFFIGYIFLQFQKQFQLFHYTIVYNSSATDKFLIILHKFMYFDIN